jgi:hypothetical protein
MPSWLTEVLELLGLTTPLVYAAATYGLFRWLDKKASGPAKRALCYETVVAVCMPQTFKLRLFISPLNRQLRDVAILLPIRFP